VQQPQAGLEIKATVPTWLAVLSLWLIYIFPPKVTVDGSQPIPGKWGDNLIPMTPGRHMVTVYYALYWFIPASRAELVVDIPQGQVAQLQYSPKWFWFLRGAIAQTGVRGMMPGGAAAAVTAGGGQGAGWHPDPAGRHELRYWDGSKWTDDVSDKGVTTKDPAG